MSIKGRCLCGDVKFEIVGGLFKASNCHCSMCRRHFGSAFLSLAGVRTHDLHWLSGEELIGRYASSPGVERLFCKRCGSTLAGIWPQWKDVTWIGLGALDDDPGIKPSLHIFTGSKAPWFEIADAIPQHQEL
jgi:hypothetical protein